MMTEESFSMSLAVSYPECPPVNNMSTQINVHASFGHIPYYGLFLCDIQISVLQIEIHQTSEDQSVRGATHYDIIKDNDIIRDTYYVTMGNDVTRDILCDVTMSKDIAMCTYHGITMHNGIAMNLFFYVL